MTGDRRVEYMPLADIVRAPRNPKTHDRDAIERSISHHGLADLPVLDDRTGRLVSGHGRLDDLQARHEAGGDPPDGVRRNKTGAWLVPVVRGWSSRSDEDAEAYLLMANKSTMLGGWDVPELGQMLGDLNAVDLLALTGFPADEFAKILGALDEPRPPGEFPEYDDETIPTEHECPACGYRFSGKSTAVKAGD